jgi:hypothetical protein
MVWSNKVGKMIYKPRFRRSHIHRLLIAINIIIGILISLSVLGSCGGSGVPSITQYTLTVHLDTTMAIGDNTIIGAGIYDEGSVVNIRANPETGWEFIEWTGNIVTVTNRFLNNTDIVMNGDYDITAHFTYPVITHTISNVVFNPQWPATLNYGERVRIGFDYSTNDKSAVYVFMHPFLNGSVTPGYLYSGTNFYHPWEHKGEIDFTISLQSGQVVVDQIRFQIMNVIQTKILYEVFVPVSYTFQ